MKVELPAVEQEVRGKERNAKDHPKREESHNG